MCRNIRRLGEPLDHEQVDEVFKDCMPEENDDGEILYTREYFVENNAIYSLHVKLSIKMLKFMF